MFRNLRKHKRETVEDCTVESISGIWSSKGLVLDLSESGMKVDMEEIPPRDKELTVAITCESGMELEKKAVVAWFIKKNAPEVGAMVGLKFVDT